MFRNKSVNLHDFAMVPRADIPRSMFRMEHIHKTSFNAGDLIPIYVDEMLPGDTFNMSVTGFVRLSTPIFPTLDNLHCETFFFVVPMRLLWEHFVNFMGERRPDPDSSIVYGIPEITPVVGGYDTNSLFDYFGLPCAGQVDPAESVVHSALPLRAYNLIWNEWFRDENLQDSAAFVGDDGPDSASAYVIRKRGKRKDYITGCLPFAQKGTAVSLPLGDSAPVVYDGTGAPTFISTLTSTNVGNMQAAAGTGAASFLIAPPGLEPVRPAITRLEADLSAATAATINDIRLAFQTQRLLERDARGGTRYTELVRAHFNVVSPDSRLQRPEYIGGSSDLIVINPIAQTSATSADGTDTPQGNLSAVGTGLVRTGFRYSATEHSYVIGLVNVRADLTYQQGLRKLWSRSTRYDFYWPAFAMLGEQAVLSKEVFCNGAAADESVFGYQERWAEYRYFPSLITGRMKSTAPNSIDSWHYAEEFATRPTLGESFITDKSADVVNRSIAVPTDTGLGTQFLADFFFANRAARPMPMYSVPGLVDHF